MKIKFRTYDGLAGDFHSLLIGIDEEGNKEFEMFNRVFWSTFSRWRARRKIINKFKNRVVEI